MDYKIPFFPTFALSTNLPTVIDMRKLSLLFVLLLLLCAGMQAQRGSSKVFSVAFYNLENLFDTIHDAGKNDYEYLPSADKRWDTEKYTAKQTNMAKVLSQLSVDRIGKHPAVVGLAEIENLRVLEDLVAQPALAPVGYQIVHHEGPDKRGIDCALLYDPRQFKVQSTQLVLSEPFEGDTVHVTRGFLIVNGKMGKDKICFIVNHWPSRGAKAPVRVHAARQVRALVDSLQRVDHKLRLVVMGDMNDDPMDESLIALGGRKQVSEVGEADFYNPWWSILEDQGRGTLMYRGKWNLFDQILVSHNLLGHGRGLRYLDSEIFSRDWLIQQTGNFKGSPFRTFGGKTWLNGYSDHLPVIVYLER